MEIKVKLEDLSIHHSEDIYKVMQLFLKREKKLNKDREHFWVIALNRSNYVINIELLSIGNTVHTTPIKPMEVLSIPLQKRALGVILIHNHPSGDLSPSEQDKDVTDLLIQACKLMRTPVLDHVIITEHSYYSFKDSGLLRQLEESNKYVLPYDLEKKYYEEMMSEIRKIEEEHKKQIDESTKKGEQTGLEKGKKEERYTTALKMLQLGMNIETISTITTLSKEEILSISKENSSNLD